MGSLLLGGIAQAIGTYGSTASSALFQSDEFFAGTGIVTVVPEPGSIALLGLGVLGLIRRRRNG